MCASALHDERVSTSLLADVERNPIGVMRMDAVRLRFPHRVEYLMQMNRGVQQRQNGRQATGFFVAASRALRQRARCLRRLKISCGCSSLSPR